MATYYPYVVLETNINPSLLEYLIQIKDTVSGKNLSPSIYKNNRTTLKKIGNLYQTDSIEISGSKIGLEKIRDCVIIFTLYRKDLNGKLNTVLDQIIPPNKIESFISKTHSQNKDIAHTKYKEASPITKQKAEKSTNTVTLNLNRNRIFQCIDDGCKPGEPNDPFSKAQIEAGLQSRLNEPLPDQDITSLCGPAAYFFCLINLSPSKYKLAVKQLWETGQSKIGELEIKPSINGCRKVQNFYKKSNSQPKIPPIDWITLASLRESENIGLKLNDPSQEVAGITTWGEVANWFKKSGFKGVKKYPFYLNGYNPSLISEINQYAGEDYYVVTLISASLLSSGTSSGTQSFPDHWIIWTDKLRDSKGQAITIAANPYTTEVSLKMFTWGEESQRLGKGISLYNFEKKVFFAMLVKKETF
ncbi:hypothetical protein AMD27_05440 [Acinetobacter sp. TGL-Y2]|uniref:hypothetical protein n=1 Tax=Acinetobacter sp. TGL-Y2 TaxID=1407071 RepID=UPI0007A64E5D|nr:hypothetical protein [Acinetobacter sp. TGL-Y2]AMW78379.1 hypothetical protein AMD27_05440 [Acinetobacter sp. TGL-Y2]